jgi:hypothetical protein
VKLSIICAATLLAATPSLADGWRILEEESLSIDYYQGEGSLMEISCDSQSSQIWINVDEQQGIRKGDVGENFVIVDMPAGEQKIKMEARACGTNPDECSENVGPTSIVYGYVATKPGRKWAIELARASSFAITAPGVRLSLDVDKARFAKFAKLCRTWD